MEKYDLIIAGAGPAGLSLARELAQSNLRILVLDCKKHAGDVRYTTSGSFITPDKWNIPSDIINPMEDVTICSANQKAVKYGKACIIDRRKLLKFLESEALKNRNLRIEYSASVSDIQISNENVLESISFRKNGVTATAKAAVYADCSGINSTIARRIGLQSESMMISAGIEYIVPLKSGEHSAALFVGSLMKGGYGWIFPLNQEKAIAGYGTLDRKIFSSIEDRLRAMWKIPGVSAKCELAPLEKHHGALRTGKPPLHITRGNVILVGDTAMQTNPIVGEGIRFVMDAAKIAAPHILDAIKTKSTRFLNRYENQWKRKYRAKYLLADRIQRVIKRKTSNDASMDRGVRIIRSLSDKDFTRLLSGDISMVFLVKIGFGSLLFH
jgi:digeranylgeranylglycerophospholipid reductase